MSSKRNHSSRSRKTYKSRMYGAYRFLKGSLSWEVKQRLRAALQGKTSEKEEDPHED